MSSSKLKTVSCRVLPNTSSIQYRASINKAIRNKNRNEFQTIRQTILTQHDVTKYLNIITFGEYNPDEEASILLCCTLGHADMLVMILTDKHICSQPRLLKEQRLVKACIQYNHESCLKALAKFYSENALYYDKSSCEDFLETTITQSQTQLFEYVHKNFCHKLPSGEVKTIGFNLLRNAIHKVTDQQKFKLIFQYITKHLIKEPIDTILRRSNGCLSQLFEYPKHHIDNIKMIIDLTGDMNKDNWYTKCESKLYINAILEGDPNTIKKCFQYNKLAHQWSDDKIGYLLAKVLHKEQSSPLDDRRSSCKADHGDTVLNILITQYGKKKIYHIINGNPAYYREVFSTKGAFDSFTNNVKQHPELLKDKMLSYVYVDLLQSTTKLADNIYYKHLLELKYPPLHNFALAEVSSNVLRWICQNQYNYNMVKLLLHPDIFRKLVSLHINDVVSISAIYGSLLRGELSETYPTITGLELTPDEQILLEYEIILQYSRGDNSGITSQIINKQGFTLQLSTEQDESNVIERIFNILTADNREQSAFSSYRPAVQILLSNGYFQTIIREHQFLTDCLSTIEKLVLDGTSLEVIRMRHPVISVASGSLADIASHKESSMRALTPAENKLYEWLEVKYPAVDVVQRFEEFIKHLYVLYEQNPARYRDKILPAKYDQFCELIPNKEAREAANKCYYSHTIHTVIRWLTIPNPWIDPNAPFTNGRGGADFEGYEYLILTFWEAARDPKLMEEERSIELFFTALALIGRAHNWDLKNAMKQEYDDMEGDKPACLLGVKKRLFTGIPNHPCYRYCVLESDQDRINSFVYSYYKNNEEFHRNKEQIKDVIDEYSILFDEGLYPQIARYNIPDEELIKLSEMLVDGVKICKNSELYLLEFYSLLFG